MPTPNKAMPNSTVVVAVRLLDYNFRFPDIPITGNETEIAAG